MRLKRPLAAALAIAIAVPSPGSAGDRASPVTTTASTPSAGPVKVTPILAPVAAPQAPLQSAATLEATSSLQPSAASVAAAALPASPVPASASVPPTTAEGLRRESDQRSPVSGKAENTLERAATPARRRLSDILRQPRAATANMNAVYDGSREHPALAVDATGRPAAAELPLSANVMPAPLRTAIAELSSKARAARRTNDVQQLQEAREAYKKLAGASTHAIKETLFVLASQDKLYDTNAVIDSIRNGVLIPVSDLVDDAGHVIAPGNSDLFVALEFLGIVTPELARKPGLCLVPQSHIGPFGRSARGAGGRSIKTSNAKDPSLPASVIKGPGIGQKDHPHGIGLGYTITEHSQRSAKNFVEGGVLSAEVEAAADSSMLLQNNLMAVRGRAASQGVGLEVPSDLFMVPATSVHPEYILAQTIRHGHKDSEQYEWLARKGYFETETGVFLVPTMDLPDVIKKIGTLKYEGLWKKAVEELRLFVYSAAAPWRIGELMPYGAFFRKKLAVDAAEQNVANAIFFKMVHRYAVIAALLHRSMQSVGTNSDALEGSHQSTMFKPEDLGYSSFDHDILQDTQEMSPALKREYFEKELAMLKENTIPQLALDVSMMGFGPVTNMREALRHFDEVYRHPIFSH